MQSQARIFSARAGKLAEKGEIALEWLWYFSAYSFLGYCLEKIFARVTHSPRQVRRCFLVLPLCPVYGLAMTAILALGGGFRAVWEQIFLNPM